MGARYRIKNPSLVKQAENGFTLIELLMVISLSGILFGIIFQLFHVTEISFNRGWRNSDFYQNSQKALEIISSEMKEG
ncbi:MAG TPA: prepilin-type N-terminal cleavage/methylation domain-containing protein, partial [Bacteroidetes bacterium]|nr:prepilin-type N-terminal cleavage/methylation domain-containing protein [Bacteroidota bacterium]